MELKKQDKYLIENTVNKIRNGKNSNFLNKKEISVIISYLNKNKINYELYYPFHDAEYGIIYSNVLPKIDLIRINTKNKIRHQDILGSIYSLNIAEDIIGDIIITDNYYVIVRLRQTVPALQRLCSAGSPAPHSGTLPGLSPPGAAETLSALSSWRTRNKAADSAFSGSPAAAPSGR